MTWEEICADPELGRLSYRIETDKWGNIVMSPPPGGFHSFRQGRISRFLGQKMTGGYELPECPVQTTEGVRAMDVGWMSEERFERYKQSAPTESSPHQVAPEICVEVRSPRNSFAEIQEKMDLYFGAGAIECWVCDREERMSFFDADGPIPRSKLCPDFPDKLS